MKKPELIDFNVPPETAEFIIDRVKPFLHRYTVDLHVSTSVHGKSYFGMKELLCSVYSQGLSDANEAISTKSSKLDP